MQIKNIDEIIATAKEIESLCDKLKEAFEKLDKLKVDIELPTTA